MPSRSSLPANFNSNTTLQLYAVQKHCVPYHPKSNHQSLVTWRKSTTFTASSIYSPLAPTAALNLSRFPSVPPFPSCTLAAHCTTLSRPTERRKGDNARAVRWNDPQQLSGSTWAAAPHRETSRPDSGEVRPSRARCRRPPHRFGMPPFFVGRPRGVPAGIILDLCRSDSA